MKTASLFIMLSAMLATFNALAVEPVVEPHAMVYYQVSFGGGKTQDRHSAFGFRMDRASFSPGGMIEYQQLVKQPAMFDFRLGKQGIEGVYISGIDYLQQYRIYRAGEEEAGAEPEAETDVMVEGKPEEEQTGKPRKAPKIIRDIGNTIEAGMETAPTGVLIGLALGAALLIGAGS